MVGLTRLELVTSPLSGVHSNQLSYRPVIYKFRQSLKPKQARLNMLRAKHKLALRLYDRYLVRGYLFVL